jgi:hypothetical protein
LLSRDTLLSPTKGEGPLVVASRPTINACFQSPAILLDAGGGALKLEIKGGRPMRAKGNAASSEEQKERS